MTATKIDTELNDYTSILEFITKKQFALAGVGISDKTSFDWRKKGVYLQEKKSTYRMKYSPVEYIWLLLVKELREFGIPIKSAIHLKDFLITNIDIEGLIMAIHDSKADSDTVLLQELNSDIENLASSKTEIRKSIDFLEKHIVNSIFTSMIVTTMLQEKEYVLFIKKDGNCLIETISEDNSLQNVFLNESCLMIPFNKIVKQFVQNESIDLNKKIYKHKITQEFEFKFIKNNKS